MDKTAILTLVTNSGTPCAYKVILPSPDCRHPGVFPELTLYLLELVGYAARLNVTSKNKYHPSGYLSILKEGKADISMPYLTVDDKIYNAVPHSRILNMDRPLFIYKKYPRPPPKLDVADLIKAPSGLWISLLALIGLWTAANALLERFELIGQTSEFFPACAEVFRPRFKVYLLFWSGVLLSVLSSFLVILFTRNRPEKPPIFDFDSLHSELVSGRYVLAYASSTIERLYANFSEKGKSFRDSKYSPIKLKSRKARIERFTRETAKTLPKTVILAPEKNAFVYNTFGNFEFVVERSLFSVPNAFFFRPGLNFTISEHYSKMIMAKLLRLKGQYLDLRLSKAAVRRSSPVTDEETAFILGFGNLSGVFAAFFFLGGLAAVCLFSEMTCWFFKELTKHPVSSALF